MASLSHFSFILYFHFLFFLFFLLPLSSSLELLPSPPFKIEKIWMLMKGRR